MSHDLVGPVTVGVLLLVLAGIATGLHVARSRTLPAAGRLGDRMVRGRAARHVAMVSQMFVVAADPGTVARLVIPVVPDQFTVTTVEDGETAAWLKSTPPAAGGVRLAVRPGVRRGHTEFGVVRYAWWSRVPQGGHATNRVMRAVRPALESAGLAVVEHRREFDPPFPAVTSDGPRVARPFGS